MLLPKFFILKPKNNDQFLLYNDNKNLGVNGYLQFTGNDTASPYAKFEAIQAQGRRGFFHIRCCRNNKYLVRQSESSNLIIAGAQEREDDQSKWSCTLFEPLSPKDDCQLLRHIGSSLYLVSSSNWSPRDADLCLSHDSQGPASFFEFIDWQSIVILPKYVAFKGDNGKYLCVRWIGKYPFMQFSADDIGDASAQLEILTWANGSIHIKSLSEGKYLDCSSEWCCAGESSSSYIPAATFYTRKVEDGVIALHNKKWNRFVERVCEGNLVDCLKARSPNSITYGARLKVEELVRLRTIYDVDFNLNDSRVYNKSVITMAKGVAVNHTNEANVVVMKLAYTETKSRTWTSSVLVKLGVSTTIKTGIPLVAEGKVEMSLEASEEFEWEKTHQTSIEHEFNWEVTVPPMTQVRVSILASKATCEVPFSYTQRDVLCNGSIETRQLYDGLYKGINCFDIKYETKEEPL